MVGGKPRRDGEYWRPVRPEEIVGAPLPAGFSTPTPLGTNSRPELRAQQSAAPRADTGPCPWHAQLVAGALVTVFLAPATAGYAQESSTTTTSTTTTTTTPRDDHSDRRAGASPTTPEARPGRVRRAGQPGEPEPGDAHPAHRAGRPGDAAPRRRSRPRSTRPSRSSTRPEPRSSGSGRLVRERAAYIYRHADTPQDRGRRHRTRAVTSARGSSTRSRRRRPTAARSSGLSKVSAQLDAHRKQLEADRAEQQQQKDRLDNAKAALEALTAHQKKLLDQAGAIPVMGDAELTAAEITAWFEARNVKYRLAGGLPIADLVQLYMEEGKAEHVRPGAGLRPVDHRDRLVRQRARQQLRRHRRLRQLPGRAGVPDSAGRRAGSDPAAAQLRRPDVACREPRQPAVTDDLRQRSRECGGGCTTPSSPRAARRPGT